MRIDSHQHFWKYDPVRDSWMDDSMQAIRKDFLPGDLETVLRRNGMDGCVAVQADQSEEETAFLLACAARHSFVKGVVGWVDLCAANVEDRLSFFAKNPYFKGVRHILQAEKEGFALSDDFQRGIGSLAKFGLTYDLLVYPNQLGDATELVESFPRQKFVLDHLAKPSIKTGAIDEWEAAIVVLAQNQHVYCKLSGLLTEADWHSWTMEGFEPYLKVVFDAFGPKRLMFGSDWPVCLLAGKYASARNLVENYMERFSYEEQAWVMGGNASRFYGLEVHSA